VLFCKTRPINLFADQSIQSPRFTLRRCQEQVSTRVPGSGVADRRICPPALDLSQALLKGSNSPPSRTPWTCADGVMSIMTHRLAAVLMAASYQRCETTSTARAVSSPLLKGSNSPPSRDPLALSVTVWSGLDIGMRVHTQKKSTLRGWYRFFDGLLLV
jgi:hypothetical protein